jgi:polygalacturonase
MLRRKFLAVLPASAAMAQYGPPVTESGAVADGRTLATEAVQRAIDAVASKGGGTVWFPAGRYLCGTLRLRSRTRLHLDPGAVLLGSTRLSHYPSHVPKFRSYADTYVEQSLIYAEGEEDVGIEGEGTIDGQGAAFKGHYKVRPYMIRFINCRNVSVRDVTLRNSPMWVQHYLACDGVAIRDVTVQSRVNANNDGIDIDCCDRVRISGCDISSGDDAIVLKSTADRVCRNVTVTNCVLSTACSALKLGTESNGGFENIAVSNCTIYQTRLGGIAIETVDGGVLDGVSFSNIIMDGVGAPLFVRLGNRARPFREGGPKPGMGIMRNIQVTGIQARSAGRTGCAISGLPGHDIENLTLENLRFLFAGGGKKRDGEAPELPEKYPEFNMFGDLPAYGLWCRHVRGLELRNIQLTTAAPDARPPVLFEDVKELKKDF